LVPAFIVVVLLIAAGTWLAWQYIDPQRGFAAMLSVLVASCPCALSLALPVVHAAASRRLLDEGILLTRGESLQALNHVDTVVFDKTGTLTRGVPEIVKIEMNPDRPGLNEAKVLHIAAALESSSAHPIAHAFMAAAKGLTGNSKPVLVVKNTQVHPARGLEAQINGKRWKIGTAAFANPSDQRDEDDAIWLADSESWIARFILQDALRDDTEAAIRKLRQDGLQTAILSGDSASAVVGVAEKLDIENWYARQTPQMKLERLEVLRSEGHSVLMIGDGVNDAPVLAAADVSMTVKGGAELANSTADMILTDDSLSLVGKARLTARRAQLLIRQNLSWAVLYNTSVMPLAVTGMLKPWMAALGMSLSSLLVVANAARLVSENRSLNGDETT
jgi:Cu2+-exporting ATPase